MIIKTGLSVFWNVTSCSLVYTYRQFGEICYLYWRGICGLLVRSEEGDAILL